jgi:hypothetical protein
MHRTEKAARKTPIGSSDTEPKPNDPKRKRPGSADSKVTRLDKIDAAVVESFPASDPPSWTVTRIGLPPKKK